MIAMMLYAICALALVAAVFVKIFAKITCGRYKITKDLSDLCVVITGGSRGIGLETWKALASHGAKCHVFCRDHLSRTEAVYEVGELKRSLGDDNVDVTVFVMDISSQQSIRQAVKQYLSEYSGQIDILINNAGVGWLKTRCESVDGIELTMATNHFGPFLFTHLLMDRLRQSPSGRVVNVSSCAHMFVFGRGFLKDINFTQNYNRYQPYNVSKLFNVLFTRELQRKCNGTSSRVYCLHPGFVATQLFRHFPLYEQPFIAILSLFAKSTVEGSESVLHCALGNDAVPGEYHWDCAPAWSTKLSKDEELMKKMWRISEEVVKLTKEEMISV